MPITDRFETELQLGKVKIETLLSLEEQLARLQDKAKAEFRDFGERISEELCEIVREGVIDYVKERVRERSYNGTIPHNESNLLSLAKEYALKNSLQNTFGFKFILEEVCGYYDVFAREKRELPRTVFEDRERKHREDELPYFPFPSRYIQEMSKGKPEVIELGGKSYLKIYRGLEVPEEDTCSEGDHRYRENGIIDMTHPGVDWSPIRAFCEDYYCGKPGRKVLLSALVPLDNEYLIKRSIEENESLGEEWIGRYDKPLKNLTDCLIVLVEEKSYNLLRDIKVEETDASFNLK